MKSTYDRIMSGESSTAPPARRSWVYLLVAAILAAMAVIAPRETLDLVMDPVGIAAAAAIIAGFIVQRSMALTPWALVCAALIFYGIARHGSTLRSVAQGAQLVALVSAIAVGALQMRVRLVSGAAASSAPRARWGSVLVALTAALVVIILGSSTASLIAGPRGPSDVKSDARPAILASRYGHAVRVGQVQDPSLAEVSGLAASDMDPGVLWAHNDSGNPPVLFCMLASGVSCGSVNVTGADNVDWEDIDIGPGSSSGSYIYVGDIGDNSLNRESVTVYRVPEPQVDPSSGAGTLSVTAEAFEFRYPDGPHDAETLLIHPRTGDLYIVTKDIESGVYKAPAPLSHDGITTLERVARFSIFASLADVTGGDISPDGQSVALATYGGGYELVLPSASSQSGTVVFDDIWHVTPARVDSGKTGQLEAVTYTPDGMSLLFVPEGIGSPISRSDLQA